jgi:hypothetical protein
MNLRRLLVLQRSQHKKIIREIYTCVSILLFAASPVQAGQSWYGIQLYTQLTGQTSNTLYVLPKKLSSSSKPIFFHRSSLPSSSIKNMSWTGTDARAYLSGIGGLDINPGCFTNVCDLGEAFSDVAGCCTIVSRRNATVIGLGAVRINFNTC